MSRLNAGLAKRFGDGQWAVAFSASTIVLNSARIRQGRVVRDELEEEARSLLLAEPGIAAVYTRHELDSGSRAGAPLFDAMRKSWHRELSGDLQVALKPYWMMASRGSAGTTHGSPHSYDTHVPILFYGPAWIAPARIDSRVEVTDIAPTLAQILGLPPPSGSEGRPLPLGTPGAQR
jgi:arylsulfatase A-like enzyme